jgi:threonine synthase
MNYISTRDNAKRNYSGSEILIQGLADDGGLFVPENFPEIQFLGNENYMEMATTIFTRFLTDFEKNDIQNIVKQTYSPFNPSVLTKINDRLSFLELWHGKTSAFKDVALQILPRLLTQALKNRQESAEVVILVATSGDTGKAALEGFANVPQTKIAVFYPQDGVSDTQKQQMVTQEGDNVAVFAIKGNFDDAQTAVKKILNDSDYLKSKPEVIFSSANSINWGRLMPQIVYYFSSYFAVAEGNEKLNFIVPTGNFGDILAGYYAKKMGLPIDKLICASNKNHVLTDFIRTGVYSVKRPFYKTISPSMDILVSSNLERLLFDIYEGDAHAISGLMNDLKEKGEFQIGESQLANIQETFIADFATEEETKTAIQTAYEQYNYLIDTHTAVAFSVYEKQALANKTVILSTASPYKFPEDVFRVISKELKEEGVDYTVALFEKTGVEIPKNIKELNNKKIIHTKVIEKDEIKKALDMFLSLEG